MPACVPQTLGDYRIKDSQLGCGSFGTVSLAEDMSTGSLVAIKTVSDSEWDACEHRCLSALSHPNILRLRGYYRLNGNHHLVTDYAQGGDLFDFLEGKPYLEESIARHFFTQLVACIEHVHRSGYAHRDLKLENIFLDGLKRTVIIGDWGFATSWSHDVLLTERCGTLFYLPPEMITGSGYYGPEVDMWSLGVLLYYLLVGNLPFDAGSSEETEQSIIRCRPNIPNFLSNDARSLLQTLLAPAALRPAASQILRHPWLQNEVPSAFPLSCAMTVTAKRDSRTHPLPQLESKRHRHHHHQQQQQQQRYDDDPTFFDSPFDFLPHSDTSYLFDEISPLVYGQS